MPLTLTPEEKIKVANDELKAAFIHIEHLGKFFSKEKTPEQFNKLIAMKQDLKHLSELLSNSDFSEFSRKLGQLDQAIKDVGQFTINKSGLIQRIEDFQEILSRAQATADPKTGKSSLQRSVSVMFKAETTAAMYLSRIDQDKDLYQAHLWLETMEKKFQMMIPGRSLKTPERSPLTVQTTIDPNAKKGKSPNSPLFPIFDRFKSQIKRRKSDGAVSSSKPKPKRRKTI